MRFKVEYQYRPQDNARPLDYVQSFDMQGNEATFLPIPNIGDHVSIEEAGFGKGDGSSICVVESRTFFYAGSANDPFCAINIVLTDSDVDPGRLIKM
jgi:hypothetical protein